MAMARCFHNKRAGFAYSFSRKKAKFFPVCSSPFRYRRSEHMIKDEKGRKPREQKKFFSSSSALVFVLFRFPLKILLSLSFVV
jgi:hypothetical protein